MIQSIFARPVQILMTRLGCGRHPCEKWAQCSHRLPPVGGASRRCDRVNKQIRILLQFYTRCKKGFSGVCIGSTRHSPILTSSSRNAQPAPILTTAPDEPFDRIRAIAITHARATAGVGSLPAWRLPARRLLVYHLALCRAAKASGQ